MGSCLGILQKTDDDDNNDNGDAINRNNDNNDYDDDDGEEILHSLACESSQGRSGCSYAAQTSPIIYLVVITIIIIYLIIIPIIIPLTNIIKKGIDVIQNVKKFYLQSSLRFSASRLFWDLIF